MALKILKRLSSTYFTKFGAGIVCNLPKKYDLPLPTSSTVRVRVRAFIGFKNGLISLA